MPTQPDDVLLSVSDTKAVAIASLASLLAFASANSKQVRLNFIQLQSSLRNALSTFGPNSTQYLMIKYMVDEYAAKLALENMSLT